MDDVVDNCHGYPPVWIRWAKQQVRSAVAYELISADPTKGPHLRRLPLALQAHLGDREMFLRKLIARLAGQTNDDAADCGTERVTAAVLDTPGVDIAEPDLQMLLAWHLAEHHTTIPVSDADGGDSIGADHECFDPELLAAEMVASGLIAPAWRIRETAPTFNDLDEPIQRVTPASPRRTRRPAAASQLALPFTA